MTETISTSSFNRKAIIGFILAILALLALCAGVLPVPFTALICFPPGILFGIASLVLGLQAQREIRMEGQSGRTLALIATYIGGFTILAMLCMITAGVIFLPRIYEWIVQADTSSATLIYSLLQPPSFAKHPFGAAAFSNLRRGRRKERNSTTLIHSDKCSCNPSLLRLSLFVGVVRSRWVSWSSTPVAGRVASRGGFDSHPLSPISVERSDEDERTDKLSRLRGSTIASLRRLSYIKVPHVVP